MPVRDRRIYNLITGFWWADDHEAVSSMVQSLAWSISLDAAVTGPAVRARIVVGLEIGCPKTVRLPKGICMSRGSWGRHDATSVAVFSLFIVLSTTTGSSAGNKAVWLGTAPPIPHELARDAWRERVSASEYVRWLDEAAKSDGDGGADDQALPDSQVLRVLPSVNGDSKADGQTNWPDAFETLEEALAAGQSLDSPVQIWVAVGTHIPGGPAGSRSDSFVLFDGVELLGGFAGFEDSAEQRDPVANPTILSGNRGSPLLSDDNNFHVLRFEGFFKSATIDGFIIRDGNANGSGDDRFGGGIFVKNASLTVRDCLFMENNATKGGGGMHTSGSLGTIVVESSVFANNTGETGGGLSLANGGTVRNCSFLNNNGVFGGGLSGAGAMAVENSLFENNFGIEGGGLSAQNGTLRTKWTRFQSNAAQRGAGVRITGGNNHIISNCRFVLGIANEGAGIYTTGPCSIVNSLIAWNNAFALAGGVYSSLSNDASTHIIHSTIWKNSASQNAGGLFVGTGNIAIANSVLFENSAFGAATTLDAQVFSSIFGTRQARYSCIEGSGVSGAPTLGPGNFGDSPQFINPLGPDGLPGTGDEDFTPGPNSPLLDRAEDASIPQDVLDLDGDGNTTELIPLDLLGGSRFVAWPDIPSPLPGSSLRADIGAVEAPDPTDVTCIGDINGDGIVDLSDLSILLSQFGNINPNGVADLNGDGVVDVNDLSIMLNAFGSEC